MPANLTAQYHKAEEQYRQAQTPEDELRCLELMLREIPKHKGTDKLQAELKHKISRAKEEVEQSKKSGGKKSAGIKIPRQGAGRVVIIGGPNSGKSQLLASLTRAAPEIAPYPFTTREVQPGMMAWEDISVQLLDTPPITVDVFDTNLLGIIRGSDLVLLLVDLGDDDGIDQLQQVLDRLGGTKTRLARESSLDEEDIGLSYTQAILVLNKIDLPEAADRLALLREFIKVDLPEIQISALEKTGLAELTSLVIEKLDIVRVYTKLPNKKEADYDKPFTLRRGGTLLDVAEMVHRDIAENFKYARVWGSGVIGGSQLKGDYVVHDKDVVEIHV
ncbi:GTP-binding protein HSR1-related protein [Pirellula staleyi DSM 6068]|uniref:GTP-binding protein HSR1-related protein n=1 Tax=Pirellula staleyi (strain ATCC 27377 / DSM 6068 / ICPB 4128) TaxID=530564 RepID=D2R880_PIRSD|nr:GTPase [Pirellula staleyi]ADB15697.1 GTP-binding protein HSR1-related protein [Pirellula staleyi DSM 6068]